MYDFRQINHQIVLTNALLVGLTPLIPIPYVDDWLKGNFQRRMVSQIAAARGHQIPAETIQLLIADPSGSCLGGCFYTLVMYPVRKLLRKFFFILEWRRSMDLISHAYYTGFLLDSALMSGYAPVNVEEAYRLRAAILTARQGANINLMKRIIRENVQPGLLVQAAGQISRQALRSIPQLLSALPRVVWQTLLAAPGWFFRTLVTFPGRVFETFAMRVRVLLGKQRAPELEVIERMVKSIQAGLLDLPPDHFDALHARLLAELRRPAALPPGNPAA